MKYDEPLGTLESDPAVGERASWWNNEFLSGDELDAAKLSIDEDPIVAWQEALLAGVRDNVDAWRLVLDATTEGARAGLGRASAARDALRKPLIALEPVDPEDGARLERLLVPSALRRIARAGTGCAEALWLASNRGKPGQTLGRWGGPRGVLALYLRIIIVACGAPRSSSPHLEGTPLLAIAPSAVMLPRDFSDVRAEIEAGIARVLSSTRETDALLERGLDAYWRGIGGRLWAFGDSNVPRSSRVEAGPNGGWRVPADAMFACRLIEGASQLLLPRSISARYALLLSIRPPFAWPDGKLELRLRRNDSERARSFPVEDAADGDQLWLQLALLEATAALERAAVRLRFQADLLMDALEAEAEEPKEHEAYLEEVLARNPPMPC